MSDDDTKADRIARLMMDCVIVRSLRTGSDEQREKLEEIANLSQDTGVPVVFATDKYLKDNEIPGLEEAVRNYFNTHLYNGYRKPFELVRLARSGINSQIIHTVIRGMTEELDGDDEWEDGLAKVGAEFGVPLGIPPYYRPK